MAIEDRVDRGFRSLAEKDYESALIAASIAVDATAKRERRNLSNNKAYKAFIKSNMPIITRFSMGGTTVYGDFRLGWTNPDVRADADGLVNLEQILYHVVRCGLVHEAELPSSVVICEENRIGSNDQGQLILPSTIVVGLLVAVIASPRNKNCVSMMQWTVDWGDGPTVVTDYWGEKLKLLKEIESPAT